MINLDTLDTIIAMVVVLLILSLIVQSIQSFIKKIFKVKSGTILNSLKDLFDYVDISGTGKTAEELVEEVKGELKKIGRVSFRGNLMIDSIAKGDLDKILEKLGYVNLRADAEKWFSTVMQSFEERYTRHMKTVALIISIIVVIVLNANFFTIYQKIATDPLTRGALVAEGEELRKKRDAAASLPEGDPTRAQIEADLKKIKDDLARLDEFGFKPLTLTEIKAFWGSNADFKVKEGGKALAGWALMALLLSVGAPFWQDTLESLFGIKNLLRKRSDTKNVEGQTGGQTRP